MRIPAWQLREMQRQDLLRGIEKRMFREHEELINAIGQE
jgi:hypothetical protein